MKVLVTGGGGFLGGAIVRRLLERGDVVTSISRHHHMELDDLGVRQIQGDVSNRLVVGKALQGNDLVFHVAAKAGVWGPYQDYYQANVEGTANVIDACKSHGVKKLVYTSSPSVVFDGTDQENCNESVPYPHHYMAHYPKTKAIAEQMVLDANSEDLATISLRPHLIWGPGDNHLVPRIIERGKAGRIRIVGDPNKLVDSVYVDNAADAHILASDQLSPGASVAGKAYFITNNEPMPMQALINGILQAADLPKVTRRIPAGLAYAVGGLLEVVYSCLGKRSEPIMTRFVARQLSTAHYYDISAARDELGYQPRVSIAEGLELLARSLEQNDR